LSGASIAAGATTMGVGVIQQAQSAATKIATSTAATDSAGTNKANGAIATFTTNWTGTWTLALRHAGVTAGGTCAWSWSVYVVTGQ
jgi:hypothetical protein